MSDRTPSELDLRSLLGAGRRLAVRAGDEASFAATLFRAGAIGIEPPRRVARIGAAMYRYGLLSGTLMSSALRHPDQVAARDERGDTTYRELDEQTNAIANAWRARGLPDGAGIAILVRNHVGFLQALFAASKVGARMILLNTSFAGPQLAQVADREGAHMIVADEEYSDLLAGIDSPHGHYRAWVDDASQRTAPDTLDGLIASASTEPPTPPDRLAKIVVLTSGTTGSPKGAPRDMPKSLSVVGGVMSKVPFRATETTVLAAPMFHAHGLAGLALGFTLSSTLVLDRRFDPGRTLDAVAVNDASALIVVPVMLQRILELGEDAIRARDLRDLRIIFASGSAVSADVVRRSQRAFGPVFYNMYGSTEVAEVSIATPEDLAEDPSTVGGPVRGTVVEILDEHGRAVAPGTTGRIFVGNSLSFTGYTGGEDKERLRGLVSSGDVGHLDADGRLYIDGRDDEMIVSGGENVFPAEVENLLADHEAVAEAAAIGVDDEQFGARLRAFVVLHDGAEASEDDLKEYVRANLARYKVPREVVFLAELPRNQTGKVLKRELPER